TGATGSSGATGGAFNDYGFFVVTTNPAQGSTAVALNGSVAFAAVAVSGGITYASPTITIANAGTYELSYGFSVASLLTTAAFELFSGALLGASTRVGTPNSNVMTSTSAILTFGAGATLQLRNVSSGARTLSPPDTVEGGVAAYLTISRLQ